MDAHTRNLPLSSIGANFPHENLDAFWGPYASAESAMVYPVPAGQGFAQGIIPENYRVPGLKFGVKVMNGSQLVRVEEYQVTGVQTYKKLILTEDDINLPQDIAEVFVCHNNAQDYGDLNAAVQAGKIIMWEGNVVNIKHNSTQGVYRLSYVGGDGLVHCYNVFSSSPSAATKENIPLARADEYLYYGSGTTFVELNSWVSSHKPVKVNGYVANVVQDSQTQYTLKYVDGDGVLYIITHDSSNTKTTTTKDLSASVHVEADNSTKVFAIKDNRGTTIGNITLSTAASGAAVLAFADNVNGSFVATLPNLRYDSATQMLKMVDAGENETNLIKLSNLQIKYVGSTDPSTGTWALGDLILVGNDNDGYELKVYTGSAWSPLGSINNVSLQADQVEFDNSTNGFEANKVQGAIEEVNERTKISSEATKDGTISYYINNSNKWDANHGSNVFHCNKDDIYTIDGNEDTICVFGFIESGSTPVAGASPVFANGTNARIVLQSGASTTIVITEDCDLVIANDNYIASSVIKKINGSLQDIVDNTPTKSEFVELEEDFEEQIEDIIFSDNLEVKTDIPAHSTIELTYIKLGASDSTITFGVSDRENIRLGFYEIEKDFTYRVQIPKGTNAYSAKYGFCTQALETQVSEETTYRGFTPNEAGSSDAIDFEYTPTQNGYLVVPFDYTCVPTVQRVISAKSLKQLTNDVTELVELSNDIEELDEFTKDLAYNELKQYIEQISTVGGNYILQSNVDVNIRVSGTAHFNIGFYPIEDGITYYVNVPRGTNAYGRKWCMLNTYLTEPVQESTTFQGYVSAEQASASSYTFEVVGDKYKGSYLGIAYNSNYDAPQVYVKIDSVSGLNERVNELENGISSGVDKMKASISSAKIMLAQSQCRPFIAMFIGNSWTLDATERLGLILNNLGIQYKIYRAYKGSGTLSEYYNNIGKDTTICEVSVGSNGKGYATVGSMTTEQMLALDDFDLVSFQQQSGTAGDYNTFQPYLNALIERYKELGNIIGKIYFHSTWAYPNGCTHPDFSRYNNNHQTMYAAIIDAWNTAMTETEIYNIIPNTPIVDQCATIWSNAGKSADLFYTNDGTHLNPVGEYAAALGYAQTIISTFIYPTAINNKSVLDCTYYPDETNITEWEQFKQVAYDVVSNVGDYYSCLDEDNSNSEQ